jgi:hypothetical protein
MQAASNYCAVQNPEAARDLEVGQKAKGSHRSPLRRVTEVALRLRYRGFEISVVQGIDGRFWKWTVSLDSRRLTGHASSKPKAFARAEIAIDQAVAPAQLIIGERAAGLLHEVRELPPGQERDSILEEIEKVIAGLAALKTKAT